MSTQIKDGRGFVFVQTKSLDLLMAQHSIMLKIIPKIMMTPIPIPTPPMMCNLLLNISSMAAGQLVVMRTSSPVFLGQVSLAASITVPVGPQQSSYEQETGPTQL